MQLLIKAILFAGIPSVVLIGADVGGLWSAPQWLLGIAYTMFGLTLLVGIMVGIYGRGN